MASFEQEKNRVAEEETMLKMLYDENQYRCLICRRECFGLHEKCPHCSGKLMPLRN